MQTNAKFWLPRNFLHPKKCCYVNFMLLNPCRAFDKIYSWNHTWKKGVMVSLTCFWRVNNSYLRQYLLGLNATVLQVTLEKMLSEYLQNCPRNIEHSSSSKDSFGGMRMAIFSKVTRRTVAFKHWLSKFWLSKFCSLYTDFHKPWHYDCRIMTVGLLQY